MVELPPQEEQAIYAPEPYRIDLSLNESSLCIDIGIKRRKTHTGLDNRSWHGEEQRVVNDILGAKVECATRIGLWLDVKPILLKGGDKGFGDMVLPSGKTIEAKGQRRKYYSPDNYFAYNTTGKSVRRMKDDFGVLGIPAPEDEIDAEDHESAFEQAKTARSFIILGFITRDDFYKYCSRDKMKYGECDRVFPHHLTDFRILRENRFQAEK